jgi:type I restriction enzyme R subunit
MFLTGLTATAEHTTHIYFDQNVVTEHKHQEAVSDGVNVPYTTYQIRTEITGSGGRIAEGSWVDVRDLGTRRREGHQLEDELSYDPSEARPRNRQPRPNAHRLRLAPNLAPT